ncbi:hypothetical protein LSH36_2484g00003 [Paralvinella palmiformis]|uniref:C-type lectin domain-containing protein n=1 Tax=Paralvinella palmiformis TaxID=53620 RepID=A0AAD9IQ16_9ANNE|nr:hypothetical protein LSH36_2484g00003 [Paralvinella palmiformis]
MWIGGRRSTDDKWRYMNGSEFNKQITTPSQTASYCLYVRLCKDSTVEYHDDNCDEKTTSSRLLCQYDQSKTAVAHQIPISVINVTERQNMMDLMETE